MVTAKDAKVVVSLDFQANGQSLGRAVRDIEKNLNALQRRSAQVGKSMSGIIPAFAATGAAAFSAYKFATSAAIQFEDSFAGIKKTLNFTEGAAVSAEKKFKNLSDEIRDIAKTTPIATNELNKIGEIGGQLGIQASQIGKFVDTISKLTVATNMGAEDAAFAISRLANITGTAEKDIDNLASTLVRLGNEFAATESEIINTALGIATAMESLESPITNSAVDAMALATALKAVGVQSQSGATAVQRALDVMGKAVVGGGKELAVFAKISGLTIQGFEELALVDPAQAFLAFLNGLRDISNSGGDTITMLEQLGLSQQRTVRALRALAFASDDVERALKSANEEFVINNALNSEAEKRYQTTTSQIGILRNNINDIGIELGSQTLPVLNRFISGITTIAKAKTADNITDMIKKFGILAISLNTVVQALKNVQRNMSMMVGAGKGGQGAFFADFFRGRQTNASANASAQIEMLRKEFLETLDATYLKELKHTEPHQIGALKAQYRNLQASAAPGNLQFLNENNLDGTFKAFLGTNRDTLLQVLQSQGLDTKDVDSVIRRAANEGIDVFKDTSNYDLDNLDDFQKKHINYRNQVKDSITDQIADQTKLTELTQVRNSLLDDELDLKQKGKDLDFEARKSLNALQIEVEELNRLQEQDVKEYEAKTEEIEKQTKLQKDFANMTKEQQAAARKNLESLEESSSLITRTITENKKEIAKIEEAKGKGKATDADLARSKELTYQNKLLREQEGLLRQDIKVAEGILGTFEQSTEFLEEEQKTLKNVINDRKKELSLLRLRQDLLLGDETGLENREKKITGRGKDAAISSEVMAAASGYEVFDSDQKLFQKVEKEKQLYNELSEDMYNLSNQYMELSKRKAEGLATPEDLERLAQLNTDLEQLDPILKNQRQTYLSLQDTLDDTITNTEGYVKLLKTFEETQSDIVGAGAQKKIKEGVDLDKIGGFDVRDAVKNLNTYITDIDTNSENLKNRLQSIGDEIEALTKRNAKLNDDIAEAAVDPRKQVSEADLDELVANNEKIQKLKDKELTIDEALTLNSEKRAKADSERLRYEKAIADIKEKSKEGVFDKEGTEVGELKQRLRDEATKLEEERIGLTRDKNAMDDKFFERPDVIDQQGKIEAINRGIADEVSLKQKSREQSKKIINDAKQEIQGLEDKISANKTYIEDNQKLLDDNLIAEKEKARVQKNIKDFNQQNIEMLSEIEAKNSEIARAEKDYEKVKNSADKKNKQLNQQKADIEAEIEKKRAKNNTAEAKLNEILERQKKNKQDINKLDSETLTPQKFEDLQIEEYNREEQKRINDRAVARGKEVDKMSKALLELREITQEETLHGKQIKNNNKLQEIQAQKLQTVNQLIKDNIKSGQLTPQQAESIVRMIDTGQIGEVIDELGQIQSISDMFGEKGMDKRNFFDRFKLRPETVEGIRNIREEINNVGTGLFGLGNKFKNFGQKLVDGTIRPLESLQIRLLKTGFGISKLVTKIFKLQELPFRQGFSRLASYLIDNFEKNSKHINFFTQNVGRMIKMVGRGIKFLGLFGKNMDNLAQKFVTSNKLTPQMIRMMVKLTTVIRGVGAAIMGLVANMAIMAAMSAAMTAFFKVSENANKSQAAIDGIRGSLDDLFGDRQSLVGQKANVNVLTELLDEYKNKGTEFAEVTQAIADRLDEAESNLLKQEIEYNKKLGDIVQTTLFDSKVLGDNADVQKFLSAVGDLAGTTIDLRGTRELFFDDLFQGIGAQVADIPTTGQLTPRDILESFVDVNSFSKSSRQIFGILLEGLEDSYDLIYDAPGTGSRNFFSVSQQNLKEFMKEFEVSNNKFLGFGGDGIFSRDADKEGYFDSKGFDNYTKNLDANLQSMADQIDVTLGPDFIKIDKVSALGFRDELAMITKESVAAFLQETDGALSATDLKAGQIFLDNLIGGLRSDGTEQFKKDLVTMFASGNVIVEQAFQEMSDGKSLIAEIQTQAMLAEMKQLQNEGFIGVIVDPAKNFAQARAQLQQGRNLLLEQEKENAQKIREELDLAALELDKFNQTLTENFNKVRNTLSQIFSDMPVQVKKSIKRITEELMVKGALARNFENMIKRLSTFAPVLAEQLSKEGPKVAQIVRNFLKDRTMAQVAESGLINLFPEGASEIGVKSDQLEELKKNGLEIGSAMADGILLGLHKRGQIALPNTLVMLLNNTVQAGVDAMGIRSPSGVTRDLIGTPMIEGIVSGLADTDTIKNAIKGTMDKAVMDASKYVEELDKYYYATTNQALDEMSEAFDALFGFTSAQRDLVQANYAVQKSEQALMATRREIASWSDRYLKNQKELQRLEVEGRKGNITGSEELSILKQKVALQDMLDRAQGKRSARDKLAIANAEEELDKLKLAAEAGIVSSLEVDAAEESLAELKGDNLSIDEQRIVVLELAEANRELQNTEDKAKETSDELIAARQTAIQLTDEQANANYELEIAYDNLEAAVEGVYLAEHKYEKARDKFTEFVATSPELFDALIEGYGGVGSHIDTVIQKTKNMASQTKTAMDSAIDSVRAYLHELARADAEGMLEYHPSDLSKGQQLAQKEFANFEEFLDLSGFGGTQFKGELMNAIQTNKVGANLPGAKNQFADDTEYQLGINQAERLIQAKDDKVLGETKGRRYEFVRAMEGLLGVPFTLFESGEYGTSEEALKKQNLEYLIPELANRGVLIFDTSQKLKDYEEDFSRNVVAGVTQAGYNPITGRQSYGGQTETYEADYLPKYIKALGDWTKVTGINYPTKVQDLLNEIGFSNSSNAENYYYQMKNKIGNRNNLPPNEKNVLDNYFLKLAGALDSYLKMIGMKNTAVVKGFKYGGNVRPFQRALVGEYGPEFIQALPQGGLRVTPQGSGAGSSMVVENLNVQVTGVPSDPIQARKAAQQIQKALVNLQKEGSVGTGMRRN